MTSTYLLLRRTPALGLSLLFALIASHCAAATLYVSPTGSDDNSGTVTAPYKTIQAAVNNANAGDTITLHTGTYTGNGNWDINFGGKALNINSDSDVDRTVIDCGSTQEVGHRTFYFESKGSVTFLDGLTIRNENYNENGDDTGIVNIAEGCKVKINNCTFTGNSRYSLTNSGTAILNKCVFSSNQRGGFVNSGTTTLTNCTFTSNNGNGVTSGGIATLTGCAFTSNTNSGIQSNGTLTLTTCAFTKNLGSGVENNGTAMVSDCKFTGNIGREFNEGNYGGGGIINVGTASMISCVPTDNMGSSIGNNNSAFNGGALANGGGVFNYGTLTLTNCVVSGNSADNGGGIENKGKINIRCCSLSNNSAQMLDKGNYIPQGGAIDNNGIAILTDDILWGNVAPNAAEIWTPSTENQTTVSNCDVQGGLSGTGNIKANPLFVSVVNPIMPPLAVVSVENADLHLQAGSPCRGAGITIPPAKADPTHNLAADPGVLTDADGLNRSNPPSIGAYEYSANPPKPKKVLLTLGNLAAPDAAPVGSATTETAPTPDAANTTLLAPANQPVAEATPAVPPTAAPQSHVKLWPAEQKQENAAFLQLMVTLNTNHYTVPDMAQKIQAELDKGADINAKDSEGFPAIVTAASLAHTDVVQVLLDHGADKNAATDPASKSSAADSASILHKTAAGGYQVDIGGAIAGLFAKKPKPLAGQTALMFAALTGQADMVTLLVGHGADAQMKDSRGKTAQDYVGQGNHPEIGEMLKGH